MTDTILPCSVAAHSGRDCDEAPDRPVVGTANHVRGVSRPDQHWSADNVRETVGMN